MKKNFFVYFSCPIHTVSDKDRDAIIDMLKKEGVTVVAWPRGSEYYANVYESVIAQADAFVLALPDLRWSMVTTSMGAGILKEYNLAKKYAKSIYIAYKGYSTEDIGIYRSELTCIGNIEKISGIQGSKHQLFDRIQEKLKPHDNDFEIAAKESMAEYLETFHRKSQEYTNEFFKAQQKVRQEDVRFVGLIKHLAGIDPYQTEPDSRLLLFF
jgi:hypothetical protein